MTGANSIRFLVAAMLMAPTCAWAGSLTVVEVNAPAVNCVFQSSCTIPVTDSTGTVAMPFLNQVGTVWLQSRTFSGATGTPAAGLTGYEYRLSMTQASGFGDCLLGFWVDFGPIAKLPYKPGGTAEIYVVTSGGLGTIGLKSAEQDGSVVTFDFAKPLCVPSAPSISATTFFFGLTSSKGPKAVAAGIWGFGNPPFYDVAARAPNY